MIVLEYLSTTSQDKKGVIFTKDEFPAWTTFAFMYLPTIIAVMYSISWSWIDLDAKRLEPYFQMSKSQGVPAKDSLFLQYPFNFVALAPYKAFRKRSVNLCRLGCLC